MFTSKFRRSVAATVLAPVAGIGVAIGVLVAPIANAQPVEPYPGPNDPNADFWNQYNRCLLNGGSYATCCQWSGGTWSPSPPSPDDGLCTAPTASVSGTKGVPPAKQPPAAQSRR